MHLNRSKEKRLPKEKRLHDRKVTRGGGGFQMECIDLILMIKQTVKTMTIKMQQFLYEEKNRAKGQKDKVLQGERSRFNAFSIQSGQIEHCFETSAAVEVCDALCLFS